jgi:hypothetical protein
LTILLVAKFAPSGLATPPTDPIVFGDVVATDAGTETGSDMSGQGRRRLLPTEVPTEVVRNRDPGTGTRGRALLIGLNRKVTLQAKNSHRNITGTTQRPDERAT